MIKRIKEISSLGRFSHLQAAPFEFGPLTLLYGENALGKSTLADILSCLQTRDSAVIELRRTVPAGSRNPLVVIGVAAADGKETTVEYRNGAWSVPSTFDLRFAVFDDGFQSRNVFTGRVFERQNREHFTAFVLGREGVALAESIAEKRSGFARSRKRVATLTADAFQGITDLRAFLTLAPAATEDEVKNTISALDERIVTLRARWKSAAQFAERPLPSLCEWAPQVAALSVAASEILTTSLPEVLRAAHDALQSHISRCFKDTVGAEPWLQQGLRQNLGESCQLCGQPLSTEARSLFLSYESYFATEYSVLEAKVRDDLPRISAAVEEAASSGAMTLVQANEVVLAQYADSLTAPAFASAVDGVRAVRKALEAAEGLFHAAAKAFHRGLALGVKSKALAPMFPVPPPPTTDLIRAEGTLRDAIRDYNAAITILAGAIAELREASTPERIEEQGKKLTADREAAALILRRLSLSPQVDEYNRETALATGLEAEIELLRKRLDEDQSAFLASYFQRLNHYFQLFGSRDFELRRKVDNRGHQPVVSMEVLFRNTHIPDARVEHLFSASDRRALALSVFWAQLSGLQSAEKARTILILDDPVTSFDEHRISAHNEALVTAAREFRQVIVLSHFRDQVVRFLQCYSAEAPRFLVLQRSGYSSEIAEGDASTFIATAHENARRRFFEFGDGRSNTPDVRAWRIFFEMELLSRFADQLHRHSIHEATLKDRIDRMEAVGILSPAVAREAHDWRTRLNPEHHCWVSATIEDQRSTANELRAFIYGPLVPASGN